MIYQYHNLKPPSRKTLKYAEFVIKIYLLRTSLSLRSGHLVVVAYRKLYVVDRHLYMKF